MSGEQERTKVLGNVVSIESFKGFTRNQSSRQHRGKISITEDALGDMDYEMEGVDAMNAISMLSSLLYLSGRLLEIYAGKA